MGSSFETNLCPLIDDNGRTWYLFVDCEKLFVGPVAKNDPLHFCKREKKNNLKIQIIITFTKTGMLHKPQTNTSPLSSHITIHNR